MHIVTHVIFFGHGAILQNRDNVALIPKFVPQSP